jgi:cytochrome c oxidase cbb3-type subunit 3
MADQNEDRLLEHSYDGIQEYDNPLPRWWIHIFWVTILYSLLYALNVPGIGIGKGRMANYEKEVAEAEARRPKTPPPDVSDAILLAMAASPSEVGEGKGQFATLCAPCHQPDGGGLIGPNLTDAYWIHGARPIDVHRTVHDGVPAKGMPAWSQVLEPVQLSRVVAYVLTLRGTSPEKPKGPEGIDADSAAAAGGTDEAAGSVASPGAAGR